MIAEPNHPAAGRGSTFVALLYSIVLSPTARLKMADLQAMARDLGFKNARTVGSTGNLVFETRDRPVSAIEHDLETAYAERFGKAVPIIVRGADRLREMPAANPFGQRGDGRYIYVRLMREAYEPKILDRLGPYIHDELVAVVDGDLWIASPSNPGQTRLLGALSTIRFAATGTFRTLGMLARIAAATGKT